MSLAGYIKWLLFYVGQIICFCLLRESWNAFLKLKLWGDLDDFKTKFSWLKMAGKVKLFMKKKGNEFSSFTTPCKTLLTAYLRELLVSSEYMPIRKMDGFSPKF